MLEVNSRTYYYCHKYRCSTDIINPCRLSGKLIRDKIYEYSVTESLGVLVKCEPLLRCK